MLVNLNDEVKVKLTEEGIRVLAKKHNNFRKYILKKGGEDIGEFVLKVDKNGYYTTQLWVLLDKFKDYTGMQAGVMFEGNNLYFPNEYNTR